MPLFAKLNPVDRMNKVLRLAAPARPAALAAPTLAQKEAAAEALAVRTAMEEALGACADATETAAAAAEADVAKERDRNRTLSETLAQRTKRLAVLRAEYAEVKPILEEADTLEAAKSANTTALSELRATAKAQPKEHDAAMENAMAAHATKTKALNASIEACKAEILRLSDAAVALSIPPEEILAQRRKEIDDLKEKKAEEERVDAEELGELTKQVHDLDALTEKLMEEVAGAYELTDATADEVRTLEATIKSSRATLDNIDNAREAEKVELESRVASLTDEVAAAQDAVATLAQERDVLVHRREEAEAKAAKKVHVIETRNSQLAKTATEKLSSVATLSDEVEHLGRLMQNGTATLGDDCLPAVEAMLASLEEVRARLVSCQLPEIASPQREERTRQEESEEEMTSS